MGLGFMVLIGVMHDSTTNYIGLPTICKIHAFWFRDQSCRPISPKRCLIRARGERNGLHWP